MKRKYKNSRAEECIRIRPNIKQSLFWNRAPASPSVIFCIVRSTEVMQGVRTMQINLNMIKSLHLDAKKPECVRGAFVNVEPYTELPC